MARSLTIYRGHGFWTTDSLLSLWFAALAVQVTKISAPPKWLIEAASDWKTQATVEMGGTMCAGLDRVAADQESRTLLIELSSCAIRFLQQLRGSGCATLTPRILAIECASGNSDWGVNIDRVIRVGKAFRALLLGQIESDLPSSPFISRISEA